MDGFGWFIAVAVVFNIIRALMKEGEEEAERAPPPPIRQKARPARAPQARIERRPSVPAPRQKSPEELWQEMMGQLQRTEQARRSGQLPVEEVETWEETSSLEVEERVESLEGRGTGRKLRPLVDRDEEAEGVSEGRKVAAAARDGAITPGDHEAFDGEIRAAAPGVAVLKSGKEDLRRAVIWREILGPPVSMREG